MEESVHLQNLWGLLAKAVYQSTLQWLIHRHREQARSHTGSSVDTHSAAGANPLWERACSRWRSVSVFLQARMPWNNNAVIRLTWAECASISGCSWLTSLNSCKCE